MFIDYAEFVKNLGRTKTPSSAQCGKISLKICKDKKSKNVIKIKQSSNSRSGSKNEKLSESKMRG